MFMFRQLDKENSSAILSEMFRILHTNMTRIAPTGCSYEEDEAVWLSYMANRKHTDFVLMYAGDLLAGYFQYTARDDTLLVEEVEILPQYQRTMLFYRLCCYLIAHLPEHIRFVEAYVNKQNFNSLKICKKLGLAVLGESGSGNSWHLRGDAESIRTFFAK